MATNQTQEDWVKTALRLPRDLHADVHAEAKRQDRTFNGQIVATLRQGVPSSEESRKPQEVGDARAT